MFKTLLEAGRDREEGEIVMMIVNEPDRAPEPPRAKEGRREKTVKTTASLTPTTIPTASLMMKVHQILSRKYYS